MTRHAARKPWFQRWATRRQQRSGVWKPGTLGYSPSLHLASVLSEAPPDVPEVPPTAGRMVP